MNFVNRQLQLSIFKVFLYLIHSITDFGVRCFLYSRFPFICTDCLQDDVKKTRTENSSEFREAMRLFQLGRREDAMNALEKLEAEGRADYISEMYLEYIKDLSSDDKANVFRFVRK